MDTLTRPAGRLLAIVAIVAAAAALGGALFVVSGIGHAAPAEGGYPHDPPGFDSPEPTGP